LPSSRSIRCERFGEGVDRVGGANVRAETAISAGRAFERQDARSGHPGFSETTSALTPAIMTTVSTCGRTNSDERVRRRLATQIPGDAKRAFADLRRRAGAIYMEE